MKGIFEGTGLMTFDLDQDQQAALKKKMGKYDKADLKKAYAWAQGKNDETVTITSRSRQRGRKIQAWINTEHLPGFNIAPAKYPSITSGLTQ